MFAVPSLWRSPCVFRRRFRRDGPGSDPVFRLHYLGTEQVFSLEVEQAEEAVERLLEKSLGPDSSLGKEHVLVVRRRYLQVKEVRTGRQLTKTFLRDIACCTTHSSHPNVFLYICRHPAHAQLQCRVFWCRSAEQARDISACLALSFQRELRDWQEEEEGTTDNQPTREQQENNPAHSKDSGRGQRRRSIMSHTPLREMMRRTFISD
ncbi:uncharacterized protein [Hoplias malabaricus]|uniref:uncharacterized protein n=1 Tax=Hoplias malabaricus TaxID=27720 RepID=UPI0034625FD4